jgi:hypothetical protein
MYVKNNKELIRKYVLYLTYITSPTNRVGVDYLDLNKRIVVLLNEVVFDIPLMYSINCNLNELRKKEGLGDGTINRLKAILDSDSIEEALEKNNEGTYGASEDSKYFPKKDYVWSAFHGVSYVALRDNTRNSINDDGTPITLDDLDRM